MPPARFFSVLLAHFIYHNDHLNLNKVFGYLIGSAGVMVANFDPALLDFRFTLIGEGFVVIAAFILRRRRSTTRRFCKRWIRSF